LFFIGAGYDYDLHYNISYPEDSVKQSIVPGFIYLKENGSQSISSGPILNFLIDTRNNLVNPSKGYYLAVDYRINSESLGSTNNWNSVLLDTRKYIRFDQNRQNLLAFWAFYWAVTGGEAPYLDLPSIGWDNYNGSGRGFQQNRYRSDKLVYFETEYRKDISANGLLGFVLFANIHAVSEYSTNKFLYWHPAAGTGLRLKFNKISKTNIGLDFGASKDYFGVYFSMGEVF
jgi:outer membrane protein assembly factor BamA